MKLSAELDSEKGVGLIERVKQGLGKPSVIYVKKFIDISGSEKPTSGHTDLPTSKRRNHRPLDVGKTDCNDTDNNKPNENKNDRSNPSIYPSVIPNANVPPDSIETYRSLIYDNIEYEVMAERHGAGRLDEIVDLMLETILSKRKYIRIARDEIPAEVVRSRLLKVDSSHVEYVFDCLDQNTTKVRSIKAYLLTTLYNAPATIDNYYRAEVNHDFRKEAEP